MQQGADIRIFNPDKEISREITLDILVRHRDALKQARTGQTPTKEFDEISDNDRKFNQVRALNLIIAAQREMINISRPILYFRSMQKWKKQHKVQKDREKHPFSGHNNDYNKIKWLLGLLKACEKDIIDAERSQTLDDDFIVEKEHHDGTKRMELTRNFFEMLDELENSYEKIYLLMLTNKIVSAGIDEDEELSYKEKEQEAVRRVVEA